jgi:hypothetical protein
MRDDNVVALRLQNSRRTVSVLPSAPVALLKRKLAKMLDIKPKFLRISLHQVDGYGALNTFVIEDSNRSVDYWLSDGDEITVDDGQ